MEISAGIQASLAGRYAVALFELAAEDGVVSAVESDLDKLSAALDQSPELASLTTNPQLGRKAKMSAILRSTPVKLSASRTGEGSVKIAA